MSGAGDLRHVVRIEARDSSQDVTGQPNGAWTSVVSTRAQVVEVSSAELAVRGIPNGHLTHEVRLRYVAGVKTGMRLVWGGRVLDITGAVADERLRWLDLTAREAG